MLLPVQLPLPAELSLRTKTRLVRVCTMPRRFAPALAPFPASCPFTALSPSCTRNSCSTDISGWTALAGTSSATLSEVVREAAVVVASCDGDVVGGLIGISGVAVMGAEDLMAGSSRCRSCGPRQPRAVARAVAAGAAAARVAAGVSGPCAPTATRAADSSPPWR